MSARDLPPLLGVDEIMTRYQFRDRRTARKMMDATGGAVCVGGRLFVRADALDGWERAQATRRARAATGATKRQDRRGVRSGLDDLPRDFWKEDS